MDIQVLYNSTDITNSVISYKTEQKICTGIGLLDLTMVNGIIDPDPWDSIVIYENGYKKGTYNISTVGNDQAGQMTLKCQDDSKKLQDYFVAESYMTSQEVMEYAKPWMVRFLKEAKVDYQFTVSGNGSVLSNNTSIGMDSAYNILTMLLQVCGWYMYFNQNGKCIIGTLSGNKSKHSSIIDESEILNILTIRDDKMSRNRAVVWGNTDPVSQTSIFVDKSIKTSWQYDNKDKRAIVFANSNIYSIDDANKLAQKILNEFGKLTYTKIVETALDHNIKLGDFVLVKSRSFTGNAKATTIETSMNTKGLTHTITFDERCPRLFAWYGLGPDLPDFDIYIGTWGSGVWYKNVSSSTWIDFSDGLTNLYIKDLFVKAGVFACIDQEGFLNYRIDGDLEWTRFQHHNMFDSDGNEFYSSDIKAIACSMDLENNIIVSYNVKAENVYGTPAIRSWVLKIAGDGTLLRAEYVTIDGFSDYLTEDIESAGQFNILSAYAKETNEFYSDGTLRDNNIQAWLTYPIFGRDEVILDYPPDSTYYTKGPGYGYWGADITNDIGATFTTPNNFRAARPVIDASGIVYAFGYNKFVILDTSTFTLTEHAITAPSEWTDAGYSYISFLRDKGSNLFDFIVLKINGSIELDPVDITLYHYSYIPGGSPTLINTTSPSDNPYTLTYAAICGSILSLLLMDSDNVTQIYCYGLDTRTGTEYSLTPSGGDIPAGDTSMTYEVTHGNTIPILMGSKMMYVKYFIGIYRKQYDDWYPPYYYLGYQIVVDPVGLVINSNGSVGYLSGGKQTIYEIPPSNTIDIDPFVLYTSYDWVAAYGANLDSVYCKLNLISIKTTYNGGAPLGVNIVSQEHIDIAVVLNPTVLSYTSSEFDTDSNYDTTGVYMEGSFPQGYGVSSKFSTPVLCVRRNTEDDESGDWIINFLSLPYLSVVGTFNENDISGQWTGGGNTLGRALKLSDDYDNTIYIRGTIGEIYGFSPNRGYICTKRLGVSPSTGAYSVGPGFGVYYANNGVGVWLWKLISGYVPYDDYLGKILKHTSEPTDEIIYVADPLSTEKTIGTFTPLKTVYRPNKVEISNFYPTLIWNLPVMESGILSLFQYSVNNAVDSFAPYSELLELYIAKTADLIDPSSYFIEGGILPAGSLERYNIVSIPSGLGITKYDLSTLILTLATISGILGEEYLGAGIVNALEATNYTVNPVLLFSVSGEGLFFQRNNTESYFRDYSLGLPESDITIIRVDDEV